MMSPPLLAALSGAAACLVVLAAPSPAGALSVPDGTLIALESANRPVLRELADLRAERLGKIEERLDARLTRLEQSLAGASESLRQERASVFRQLGAAVNEKLAQIAWNERVLLIAIAVGYLWSALLWIELRRTTRALRRASVKRRVEGAYASPWPSAAAETVQPGNERDLPAVAPPA